MADETARVSLEFDARLAKQGAEQFVAAGKQVIQTEAAVAQAAQKSAAMVDESEVKKAASRSMGSNAAKSNAAVEAAAAAAGANAVVVQSDRVVKSLQSQQTMLDRYSRSLDPAGEAVRRLQVRIANLNDVVQQGGPLAARASELLVTANQRLTTAQAAVGKATTDSSRTLDAHAKSSNAASFAARDLGIQLIDVGSSLSSGQALMTVAIQQGSQVAQVMAASGTSFRSLAGAVGAAFASVGRWVAANPILTAVGAITAGLGALALEAESVTRRVLDAQNRLRGVRDDFIASQQMVEAAARHLAATQPIGTAEARAAGMQIALRPEFQGTQAQMEALIIQANALARVMGITLPEAVNLTVEAFNDAAASAQKVLDKGIGGQRGLTQAWVDSLKTMTRADAFNAFQDMMKRVTAGTTGHITAMQTAWERFQQLVTSDGEGFWHSVGQRIADGLAYALERINDLISAWQRFKNLTGGDEAERVRAQLAAQGGALGTGIPGQDPRGWTANNPLNLMIPGTMNPQAFASLEAGVAANLQQLLKYQVQGLQTVEQIVKKWVSDPKADLRSYIADIQKATGVAPGGAINLRDPATAAAFFRAAQPHETGPKRLTEAQINAGVQLGLSGATGGAGGAGGSGVVTTVPQAVKDAQDASTGAMSQQLAENQKKQRDLLAGIDAQVKLGEAAAARGDQTALNAALAQATRYKEALIDLRHAEANLIPEQQKITRTLQEQLEPLSHAAGASRTLAEVEQQFREAARGNAVDQQALSDALTAKQRALSVAAADNVRAIDEQTNANRALISSYEQGGAALQHSMDFEQARLKAQATASRETAAGEAEYARQVIALTEALDRQAAVQRDIQAAQDVNKIEAQITLAEKEVSLVNASIEVRTREIALLKERMALGLQAGEVADAEQQKAIDAATKYAALQQGIAAQKGALATITNMFETSFNTIGDAITNALISGQGAAINFRNVLTSVAQQILQSFLKLALINPILNAINPSGNRDTLGSVFNALEKGSSSSSSSGGGGTGILGGLMSIVTGISSFFGGGFSAGATGLAGVAENASAIAGTGSGASFGSNFSLNAMHTGGIVGAVNDNVMRSIPAALIANAPRFHAGYGGLRADELPAILMKGERVLTQRQDSRIASTIGGLTDRLESGMAAQPGASAVGGDVYNQSFSIDARNSTPQAVDSFRRSLPQIASTMSDQMARAKARNG